jgi:hypothetical protein
MSDTAAPLPVAQVEHRIAGRMRLRVRARRGDAAFFERAAALLTKQPGIQMVRVNPRTASILIGHSGDETAVLSVAKAQGLFEAAPAGPGRVAAVRSLSPGTKPASPLNVAAAGLAGAGVLQLLRGQVVGSASENLWNAYSLYAVTRQAGPSALLVAFGLLQIARGQVLGSATSLFLYAFSARRMARHQAGESAI